MGYLCGEPNQAVADQQIRQLLRLPFHEPIHPAPRPLLPPRLPHALTLLLAPRSPRLEPLRRHPLGRPLLPPIRLPTHRRVRIWIIRLLARHSTEMLIILPP